MLVIHWENCCSVQTQQHKPSQPLTCSPWHMVQLPTVGARSRAAPPELGLQPGSWTGLSCATTLGRSRVMHGTFLPGVLAPGGLSLEWDCGPVECAGLVWL